MNNKIILFLLLLFLINGNLFSQTIKKEGGVSFRVDDNAYISQYLDYAELFETYGGGKFNFAVNLSNSEFESADYVNGIRDLQASGHLLMDHTPSHSTAFFFTNYDINLYTGQSGVDHIQNISGKKKVCLEFEIPNLNDNISTGTSDVSGNTAVFSDEDYNSLIANYKDAKYIQFNFPTFDALVMITSFDDALNSITFSDVWSDAISFTNQSGISFSSFNKSQVRIKNDAFILLIDETQKLAVTYKLAQPNIWIQPGGDNPFLQSTHIHQRLADKGYKGAATYPNSSYKVFNEHNDLIDRQFAFQWGDFVEDEMQLENIKERIADGYAKHKVSINNIHWYSTGDWQGYLNKTASILDWLSTNNIPIDTYDNWIDKIYNQTPDPYQNIMPPLSNNFDDNDIPDGYENIFWKPTQYTGTWIADEDSPEGYAYSSNYYNRYRTITSIIDLGGLEKVENSFKIWTKGSNGNSVRVIFKFDSELMSDKIEFEFPASTAEWTIYDLTQSINSNKSLIIPADASVADIDFIHEVTHESNASEIRISGMHLAKKVAINSMTLNVLNEAPYLVGDDISVEVSLFDELGNPAITSYEYEVNIPNTSSAQLPTINLYFDNTNKATFLIKNTVSEIVELSVNLKNDPSVSVSENVSFAHSLKYVNLSVFLEGTFNTITNNMEDDLGVFIPKVSPYLESPVSVTDIPNNVVDWILITLRQDLDHLTPDPSTAQDVISQSAFVKKDGSIIGTDHPIPENIGFRVPTGYYYFVIKHRNHLRVMSSTTKHLTD